MNIDDMVEMDVVGMEGPEKYTHTVILPFYLFFMGIVASNHKQWLFFYEEL